MSSSMLGVALSIVTAALWSVSPFCFASASRRIGSLPVAVFRVILATLFLAVVLGVQACFTGHLPDVPGIKALLLIAASGIIGMGFGDLMGYEAFLKAGIQRTTLISTLSAVTATLTAWAGFGETLTVHELAGIALVIGGTILAMNVRYEYREDSIPATFKGISLAVGSAVCMGLGAVAVRWAYHIEPGIDQVVVTAVRVASSAVFLTVLSPLLGQSLPTAARAADGHVWGRIALGTLAGPFGGMLCYITALSIAPAGLCTALASLSPLFVLVITTMRTRSAPTLLALTACVTAVGGVALMMVH